MLDFVITLYRPAGADGLHGVPLVLREHLRAVLERFKLRTYRQEGNRRALRRQIRRVTLFYPAFTIIKKPARSLITYST